MERVLLVHDEKLGMEHFIREVSFANAKKSFGFVVPTPTQPDVFKVDGLSWQELETRFPMTLFDGLGTKGGGLGFGSGRGRPGGVEVLSAKRVGSFAAFVLRATDEKAMRGWLDRNKFTTTPASEAWLARYVKLGFYFVALRFEPSLFAEKEASASAGSSAETLRISFRSPIPFYPYQEPDRDDLTEDRVMALWFITNGKPRIPVSLVRGDGGVAYRRPWKEGYRQTSGDLAVIVGEKTWKSIAPSGIGPFQVQTFEDQKRSRKGFGDVLLVPEEEVSLDDATRRALQPLLPLLDPGLEAP